MSCDQCNLPLALPTFLQATQRSTQSSHTLSLSACWWYSAAEVGECGSRDYVIVEY